MTIITLITLITTLTTTSGQLADLCDIVHTDTGVPILCEPHPDGAPRLGATVCCDGQGCVAASRNTCSADRKSYYCELGQVWASNEVTCYFEVPDYCDVFPCDPGFQTWPQASSMCCYEGVCWSTDSGANNCELDDIYWCSEGVTNQDGTVTCFD